MGDEYGVVSPKLVGCELRAERHLRALQNVRTFANCTQCLRHFGRGYARLSPLPEDMTWRHRVRAMELHPGISLSTRRALAAAAGRPHFVVGGGVEKEHIT